MVSYSAVLGVFAVALALVLTPGPNMIYLVSRSISQGRRAGLVSLAGVAIGFLVYLTATNLGLAAVFTAVPALYTAVKLAGAASFATTFQLGNFSGGLASGGCTIRGANRYTHYAGVTTGLVTSVWTLTASAANQTLNIYGSTLSEMLSAALASTTTWRGTTIKNSGTITASGALIDDCTFQDLRTTAPISASYCIDATTSSTITNCTFVNAATALKWTCANALNGKIDGTTFISGGTGHAIELIGTATNQTLTNVTFTGYSGTSTDAAIYVNIATGSMIISISGGSTPSIRTAGATVTVQNAVTVKVTAKDANTLAAIDAARVLMEANSVATGTHTGANGASTLTDSSKSFTTNELVNYRIYNTTDGSDGLITANDATTVTATLSGGTDNDWDTSDAYIIVAKPALNPVSITRSGTTATVTHRNHGLANGATVAIRGATQDEYNGTYTISNVSANAYDYTVSGSPTTPATGSPTSAAVILNDVTNASGVLQTTAFNYTINQPVTGKVRRAASGTKYKTGAIAGTITSAGLDTTILLIADE